MLEEYNNSLQDQLTKAQNALELKDRDLTLLRSDGSRNLALIEELEQDKVALERRVALLELQLHAPREKITVEFPGSIIQAGEVIVAPTQYVTTIKHFSPDDERFQNIDTRIGVLRDLVKEMNHGPSGGGLVGIDKILNEEMDTPSQGDQNQSKEE